MSVKETKETPEEREARLRAKLAEIKSSPPPESKRDSVVRDDEVTGVIHLALGDLEEGQRAAHAKMKRARRQSDSKLGAAKPPKEEKP